MDLLQELKELVAAFDREQVAYALCGAVALAVHGVPRATRDIDLLVRREDLERLGAAARTCGFTLRTSEMTFAASGVSLVRFTKIADQQHLMLDALMADPPLDKVWEGREQLEWDQGAVCVVSRDGLITLKLAAGRPQDLVDVQRLKELDDGPT